MKPRTDPDTALVGTIARLGAWVRGPARREGDSVVMDFARRKRYYPGDDLVQALARLRETDQVLEFVERFGTLRQGEMYDEAEYFDGVPAEQIPNEVREPIEDFLDAARTFHQLLDARRNLRRAGEGEPNQRWFREWIARETARIVEDHRPIDGDDYGGYGRFRDWLQAARRKATDREILRRVEAWIAAKTTEGLRGTSVSLVGGEMSRLPVAEFRFGIYGATSLLQFAFFQFAQSVIRGDPIEQCLGCGEFFFQKDRRQTFCGRGCGTRARVRRFRKTRATTAEKGRATHGEKPTRTRRR